MGTTAVFLAFNEAEVCEILLILCPTDRESAPFQRIVATKEVRSWYPSSAYIHIQVTQFDASQTNFDFVFPNTVSSSFFKRNYLRRIDASTIDLHHFL